MSETTQPLSPPAPPTVASRDFPYAAIAWFTLLLTVLYLAVLRPMAEEFHTQDEMGHGFFVPVVAGYVAWTRKDELLATPMKTFWPALLLVIWGFAQSIIGILGAEFFVSRTGMYMAIVGVIWTICGTEMLKKLAMPLIILLFAIRIPLFVYSKITLPLQLFASQVAEISLNALGIPCLRNGNVLELSQAKLQVVEACSGIRSLISLTFLSVVYGYFFETRNWMRLLLFLSTIPIAIGANAFRVTVTGILYEYKREWAEGVYHTLEGWSIFMIAFAALYLVHQLLDRLAKLSGSRPAPPSSTLEATTA
jgi:exosortase